MNLSGSKKIIILGLILLILAGIIVVALKGTSVDLMMGAHKSLDIVIGKDFDIKDIETICNEVFQDKQVVLRKVEVFEDAVNVSVISITDEEKNNLITKINEKYSLELDANEITVNSNSNIRVRDIVKPYILPVGITMVLTYVYMAIRYRKLNILKVLGWITVYIIIAEAIIASIVAILRLPISAILINFMLVIAIAEIIIYLNKKEKDLLEAKVSDSTKKKSK